MPCRSSEAELAPTEEGLRDGTTLEAVPSYLSEIVAAHRRMASEDRRPLAALVADARTSPVPASFRDAIRRAASPSASEARRLAVIAEVKRRSPSKGMLAPDLDPGAVAAEYARGGAACLSVLTDSAYFGGSPEDLAAAKRAAGIPALRKDFTVSSADVCDARRMGADAVLLIAAALDDTELRELLFMADELALDALVEVHDGDELERALSHGARLVGVNQRDLTTFEVDGARAASLASLIPPDVVAVAESGVRGPDDARRLAAAGYDAVLVGESAVTAADRAAAVRALLAHPVGSRAPRSGS